MASYLPFEADVNFEQMHQQEANMAGVLSNLSDALAAVVAQASPSLVRVDARQRMGASGIVWSADGAIVTSHHVIERDENIKIGLPGGESVSASLVGSDPMTDIAVLRVQGKSLTPASWVGAETAKVGHIVLALGRPQDNVRAAMGIVSAIGESWTTSAGGRVDRYLQTEVVMYPGFSGGPLVDADAKVLGLNSSSLVRGVSVTIPTSTVKRVVETLLSGGKIQRGYLGIGTQPVRLNPELAKQGNQETGLLIVNIAGGSPAEKGGLLMGDIIISLARRPSRSIDDMIATISSAPVGKPLSIGIIRAGKMTELNVPVGEHP